MADWADDPKYYMKDAKGLWHFYCEDWANTIGPYETQADAKAALILYCENLCRARHYEQEDDKELVSSKDQAI